MDEKEAEIIKKKLLLLEELMLRHTWTSMTPGPDTKLAEEAKRETEECEKTAE